MSLGTSGQEPSKIKPECAYEESFLGDALEETGRDRIEMKALSLACPVGDPEGTRREYNRRELGRREPLAIRLRLRYRVSGNSHPSSARNLTFIRLGVINAKILSYE